MRIQPSVAIWFCFATYVSLATLGMAEESDTSSGTAETVAEILAETRIHGGMVVHLGCGDGRLTDALCADGGYTVHGLSQNADQVQAARKRLLRAGRYGPVSVELWTGDSLPYVDNTVNLIVVEDSNGISKDELLRVLVPDGVAYVRQGETWQATVKPIPDTIDEWSHYLHDAGNNAVASDSQVGPPRSVQWVAPPRWLRSHETPSGVEGLVSSGGRIFYFFDEGPIGITDQRIPERWSLVCRDAFNGRLLWKRVVEPWGWPEWAADRFGEADWTTIGGGRTVVPNENHRRLVAVGDHLYATLGYNAALSILDAATGETRVTVEDTAPVSEILACDGVVIVYANSASSVADRRRGTEDRAPATLIAVDADSGVILWQRATEGITPLALAADNGRIFFQTAAQVICLRLLDGQQLWEAAEPKGKIRTLIARDGAVLIYAGNRLRAYDAVEGSLRWQQDVPPSSGGESPDLFVIDGLVWRGMVAVNDDLKPIGKSEHAMAVGYDLQTGEQRRQVVVRGLRSPEHHHRCYRNKATERYLISGMEGAEFMDLAGDDHTQSNFLRGACKLGVMPCNGLLYAPPDQCFCQPGAKLLGFAALAPERGQQGGEAADPGTANRLERGPAYLQVQASESTTPDAPGDWPTYRRDAARHGSTTSPVSPSLSMIWRTKLGGRLSAPVAVGDCVYVAAIDAHSIYALDATTGEVVWNFIAGGRIDSPPTIYQGLVLFGSADGRAYCLRASDGQLVYRFLAAPQDLRIGCFDQFESLWPAHGSVLIREGVAYVTAGRSTYLDGGVRVYGLEPRSGRLLYETVLEGPHPEVGSSRDYAFYLLGANSDVLVSEGDYLFMRQKRLTPDLREQPVPVLSSKGEQDVGLHVFSTAGLLDDSWYNRTFWMYAKRWPGFQLANQAPKSGQLLVVDDQQTYAVRVFYRRNVHSPMFFPGKEGYLLFADRNTTEPQIVGEPGAREAIAWLPQSHIPRKGNPGLDSIAFGMDKKIGYTRAESPVWTAWIPIRIRAMVKAGDHLFIAGPPDVFDPQDPYGGFEGHRGARLAVVDAGSGQQIEEQTLETPPVFDGLIAAHGCLFISLEDGSVVSMAGGE